MKISREIQLIVVLLLVIIVMVGLMDFFKPNVVEADASKFVLEDMNSKYPDGHSEIMMIRPKYNSAGQQYFEVKAKVTRGYGTPCPERIHVYYNYPEQNFISQPNEYITAGCEVCTEGICTVAFPEEAVIASHTFDGTEKVAAYLLEYPSAKAETIENNNSWSVNWHSSLATYDYVVEVSKNGHILFVEKEDTTG